MARLTMATVRLELSACRPSMASILITLASKHWIAIYVSDDGEYFDSLGRGPDRLFERYMDEHCRDWTFNPKQLKSVVSGLCGHHCACFCILRSSGVDVLRYFTCDTGLNDVVVHGLFCKIINA